jgi:hypothetical protein
VLDSQQLQDIDPAFYEMGYARQLRAYGIEFKEGDDGVGVYAAKDIVSVKRPRVSSQFQHLKTFCSKYTKH